MKTYPLMQHHNVITNPRWQMAAMLKIVKSVYLNEKSHHFDNNNNKK